MFKLEVEKDGEFVTVYTRNLSTGVEVGGTITGEETGKAPRGASSGEPIIFEGA
jgi:hypothetical protein